MKLMLMAASLRQDSCNKKLINIVCHLLKQTTCQVDLAQFSEFEMPIYNGDIEKQGIPEGTQQFIARMQAADALIIATPEYNFSIPGTLKNLIDWVSRVQPNPWAKQQILLMSASPSLVGGNRGLWATRVPLEACGAFVFPEMFSLANAYAAFAPDGQLQDSKLVERLHGNLSGFLEYLKTIKGVKS